MSDAKADVKSEKKDDRWLVKVGYDMKNAVLGTPAKALLACGMNQHHLTLLRLFLIPLAVAAGIWWSPWWSGWIFLVIVILDMFDGTMARMRGDPSDRGKFSDIAVDFLAYGAMTGLLMWWGALRDDLGTYVLVIMPFTYVVAIIAKNEGKPTDWIIFPFPNLIVLLIVIIGGFLVYAFTGWRVVDIAYLVLAFDLTFHAARYFFELQKRWFFK